MWKDLSMQQRADLMDIYLSHGISSLDEMRKHYDSRNQFAEGGNIYSGEDEPTQQMNSGLNLYRRTNNLGETEYIYQETPDSEEILLTPTNKRFSDDPTNWDYKDASGRKYSPRMISPSSSSTLEAPEKMGPLEKYVAELNWRAKNDPASIALQGKYTMPAIAAPLLAPLGKAFAGTTIAGIPATTWANTAMAAGFAGHGLNHAINEGINGWGDATMTALELAPLGGLARPMFKEAALAVENYRYPFGRPKVPNNYLTIDSKNIIADGENWAASLPGRKDYSITRVEPYSGYTPTSQSQEYKNFVDDVMQGNSWGRHRGTMYPTKDIDFSTGVADLEQIGSGAEATVLKNPDDPSRVLKFSRDSSLASNTREAAVENAEQYAFERNVAPYNMPLSVEGAYESNGLFYPVFSQERVTPVSAENILSVDDKIGKLNNSVKGRMYYPGTARTNNILSENDIAQTLDFKPENVGILDDGSIMGIDLGIDYTGRVPKRFGSPQITAENTASYAPKVNWDADNWFKTISGRNSYSAEEAAELASHVPEYREIERRLFDEGKLTIDSKGDIIVSGSEMSPQEYIMRQSEAFQKMNPEHHYVGVSKKLRDTFENEARDPATRNRYDVWTDRKSPKNVEEYAISQQGGYTNASQIEKIENQMSIREENYELHKEQLKWKLEHGKISQETYDRDLAALEDNYNIKQKEDGEELKVLRQQEALDPLNGGKVFDVTYPRNAAEAPVVDAEGNHWHSIPYLTVQRDAPVLTSHYQPYDPVNTTVQTDQLVTASRRHGYGVTHIDNVKDTYDGTMLNETIIGRGTPVKSVLGNTGTFDVEGANKWKLYRSLLPPFLGLGTVGASYGKQE